VLAKMAQKGGPRSQIARGEFWGRIKGTPPARKETWGHVASERGNKTQTGGPPNEYGGKKGDRGAIRTKCAGRFFSLENEPRGHEHQKIPATEAEGGGKVTCPSLSTTREQ